MWPILSNHEHVLSLFVLVVCTSSLDSRTGFTVISLNSASVMIFLTILIRLDLRDSVKSHCESSISHNLNTHLCPGQHAQIKFEINSSVSSFTKCARVKQSKLYLGQCVWRMCKPLYVSFALAQDNNSSALFETCFDREFTAGSIALASGNKTDNNSCL